MTESDREPLISVEDLQVHYRLPGGLFRSAKTVKAVDGVSLDIQKGETLGLVGESGSGKSTVGKTIVRLSEASSGRVCFKGRDLAGLSAVAMREQRKHLQIIFQDPYTSLNPRMNIGEIVGEPIRTFGLAKRKNIDEVVGDLLETVGLNKNLIKRYPYEFSGGQRQRIGIARALALNPEFIVADEPISALDVSIQAQIMNLLKRLQRERDLTYLFISHDLRAVRHLAARIAVMYLGRIVEIGPATAIYVNPLMPYTKALISALPVPNPDIELRRAHLPLRGETPSPIDQPSGCHFRTRCPYAIDECQTIVPKLVEIKPNHRAACIRINPDNPSIEANVNAGFSAIAA